MKALLEYISSNTAALDNAKLLTLYKTIEGYKQPLLFSMERNEELRDIHIRYETWVLLPEEVKEKYNEDLSPIGEMPDVQVINSESEPNEESPSQEEEESVDPGEANELEQEEIVELEETQLEEWQEALIVRRGELYRQMAVLSNQLADAKSDSERGAIVEKQDKIEKEMEKIETSLNQSQESEKASEKFVTIEKLQEMSPAARQKYKEKITNLRSANKRKLEASPEHPNAQKWQKDIDAITETIEMINSI